MDHKMSVAYNLKIEYYLLEYLDVRANTTTTKGLSKDWKYRFLPKLLMSGRLIKVDESTYQVHDGLAIYNAHLKQISDILLSVLQKK